MKEIEKHICFGGTLSVYEHDSSALSCPMKFSIFLPPQAVKQDVPFITYLSGLTCTHDNFTTKAGAYGFAAQAGLAIIAPDTSPRGDDVPDDEAYDFGQGAGFYINATQDPWAKNFQMERYIVDELNNLICKNFPVLQDKQGICGHSMGGHGALTLGLKHPKLFRSISAFSPIVAPSEVPWGIKAFTGYLGNNKEVWHKHDACALMKAAGNRSNFPEILIDQGDGDDFLKEQLKPHLFADACKGAKQKLNLRIHDGYDHSYYFIQSFIEDHIKHHAEILSS
jgi:S-formylglutathione hydrolase